jgi:hypothetical protein
VRLAIVAMSCRADFDADESMPIARISPANVSTTGAWSLFDRSIESSFVPGGEPVRVTLDRGEQVSAIKVHGGAPYRLHVTGMNGSSIGFSTIDLSSRPLGWSVIETGSLIATNVVELHFEATGKPGKIPE